MNILRAVVLLCATGAEATQPRSGQVPAAVWLRRDFTVSLRTRPAVGVSENNVAMEVVKRNHQFADCLLDSCLKVVGALRLASKNEECLESI